MAVLVSQFACGALATAEACSAANVTLPLSIDQINPYVKAAQYAVRGRLLDRAAELEAQLKAGEALPFERIVRCNIGNPQALGQKPLSHVRRTLSMLLNPELLESPPASYPTDVVQRARTYMAAVPSVGAYSDSQGLRIVRDEVAAFISERDGHPALPEDIFLTDGASAGVKALMSLMIRGPHDAVLAPIPQYPLYSAATTMLNGTLAGYCARVAVPLKRSTSCWCIADAWPLHAPCFVASLARRPRRGVVVGGCGARAACGARPGA